MRVITWTGFFLSLLIVLPAIAHASEDTARKHFQRGQSAYRRGDYEEAIEQWKKAYETVQEPKIQYNLAQAYERLGKLGEAAQAFQLYIDTADPDESSYSAAVTRLASVQKRLALTGIQIKGGIDGAEILVDGVKWGRLPRPDKITVTPGTHTVVIRYEGYREFTASVVVTGGQVAEVAVHMIKSGQPQPTFDPEHGTAPSTQVSQATKVDSTSIQSSDAGSNGLGWYIVSGGLAVGALASGIWWADRGSALSICQDVRAEEVCLNETDIESQRNAAIGLTVGLGIGAIGALIVAILVGSDSDESSSARINCGPSQVSGAYCTIDL